MKIKTYPLVWSFSIRMAFQSFEVHVVKKAFFEYFHGGPNSALKLFLTYKVNVRYNTNQQRNSQARFYLVEMMLSILIKALLSSFFICTIFLTKKCLIIKSNFFQCISLETRVQKRNKHVISFLNHPFHSNQPREKNDLSTTQANIIASLPQPHGAKELKQERKLKKTMF